jgi:hypothetical protein
MQYKRIKTIPKLRFIGQPLSYRRYASPELSNVNHHGFGADRGRSVHYQSVMYV